MPKIKRDMQWKHNIAITLKGIKIKSTAKKYEREREKRTKEANNTPESVCFLRTIAATTAPAEEW